VAWAGASVNRMRGSAWKALRVQVLGDEPYCRKCIADGLAEPNRSDICDHIIPLAEGGTNERDNLAGLCHTCHNEKTLAESARSQGRREPQPKVKIGNDGWPVIRNT
jgi:5-methylcytosine-specific restriction protein A